MKKIGMQVGIPKTIIHYYLHPRNKDDVPLLKRHIPKLHPLLTEKNKVERYLFALDKVNPVTAQLVCLKFKDQMDRVHIIDEKWFHMCQDGEGYLLVDGEESPVGPLHQTQRVHWQGHVPLCTSPSTVGSLHQDPVG
jgi:hypothetical protein